MLNLKKSDKLKTVSTDKNKKTFVNEATKSPKSNGRLVTRLNFSLTEEEYDLLNQFVQESGVTQVDVLRTGLSVLAALDEEKRINLLMQTFISSPKAGRPKVK